MAMKVSRQSNLLPPLLARYRLSRLLAFPPRGQNWSWLASHCPRRTARQAVMGSLHHSKRRVANAFSGRWRTAKSTIILAVTRPKNP
jgi:hypothetical protein